MKKMAKFDGNSLVNTRQFKKVTDIIKVDKSRRCVVPSVSGKRSDKDEKVTSMLYVCYGAAVGGRSYKKILERIKSRYPDIIDGLNLNLNLDHEFGRTEENFLAKAGRDHAVSGGEYLNGAVTVNYLECGFIDAAEVIFLNDNGNFGANLTNRELSERLEHVERAVIPGLYSSKHDGTVKTFSRGGSDITGSIVAKAIRADMYENWTDVSSVLVTDPRIVDDPEVIEITTYKELRELPHMGASILREDVIFPVREEGIPINIRNTNRLEDKSTLVVEGTCRKPYHIITGIAGRRGFRSINIGKAMVNAKVGFGRKVLNVFEQYSISFEHMPSGIDTMTVYVHQSEFEEYEQSVIAEVRRVVEPDTVELEPGLAPIVTVGRDTRLNRGTAGKVFSALAYARVNVKMINQGSSEWNVIAGVKNDDFETVVHTTYDTFVITEL